jgi:hypothetical protein
MATVTYKHYRQNTVDDPINVGAPVPNVHQTVYTEGVSLVNADPDNDGGCSMRPGFIQRYTGNVSAMFANDDIFLFQDGTSLKSLNATNYSSAFIRLLLAGTANFVYVNGLVVWSDGTSIRKVYGGADYAFTAPTDEFKVATPAGSPMCVFNGHLLIGQADGFVVTDPESVDQMDNRQCRFPLGEPVILFAPVDNGIYISTPTRFLFLAGYGPPQWLAPGAVREVFHHPAIPGTAVRFKSDLTGLENVNGNMVAITTPVGICHGLNDGIFLNVTQDKDAPGASYTSGTAVVRKSSNDLYHYLVLLNDGANYTGRVMNLKTNGTATYSGYNFKSVVCHQGRYFGCNSSGIFEFTGKTDAGAHINASWSSGVNNCGSELQKYFPDAWITTRCQGELDFTLAVDEKTASTYRVDYAKGRVGVHKKRVPLAKGVKGGVAQIGWRNRNGCDFYIQQTELDVVATQRRVR